ncbi:MAG: undecaprenyldiphospho-muramoylpentapeptide beta-N-acetylglucosaminyltransferase [Eubacterium sp.]|nr:undecaprenyldiphospho-muramoylpentapeptide beta-N-acetylglucosaminyltransferase [Eubacterium sp.]
MRAIVTGGGSGGHIYPALAIAEKIKEREPGSEILYIGSDLGIEKDVVPQKGYRFEMVDARWFIKKPVEIVKTAVTTLRGSNQALKLMKEFKPDAVIGTGGFVCVPVIHAAKRYGAPSFIHEQNAFPGVANRFLERYVEKVLLGFEDAASYFKHPEKIVLTGNPVRKQFFEADRKASREKLGIKDGEFAVFCFAGSQGADMFNDMMLEVIKRFSGDSRIVILFGCGVYHYKEFNEALEKENFTYENNVHVYEYIDEMQTYLAASDIVISRAGALSLSEITATGSASLLIPSPNVTGNHQFYNAKALAEGGGAILIEEKDITPEKTIELLEELMDSPERLEEIRKASKAMSPVNASDKIVDEVFGIVKDNGKR